jgi:hypothetical protein
MAPQDSSDSSTFGNEKVVGIGEDFHTTVNMLQASTLYIPADEQGYLLHKSTLDLRDPTRPSWQLLPIQRSLLGTLKALWRLDAEGFVSLWKGCLIAIP